MADACPIDTLIAEHQQTLQLSWLTQTQPGKLSATGTMQHWIGEYTPDQYHPIELVHSDNLPQFRHGLQQHNWYLPPNLTTVRPRLIIFSNGIKCEHDTLRLLHEQAIPALQSPLTNKLILRELAAVLAERDAFRTQHGVMLAIDEQGVLLTGASGIGKSALALELVSRGHSLVADDAPLLHRLPESKRVYAVCPPLLADMLEIHALGIFNLAKLFGTTATTALMPLHLIIELVETFTATPQQRLHPFSGCTNILGVEIPHLKIPVNYPANLALLVESVSRNHVLYKEGYDASDILIQRQQLLLSKQTV